MKAVESSHEFKIPITLLSRTRANVAAEALIDTGSQATFIDERFVNHHQITRRKLSRPINLWTVDGSASRAGAITEFCVLRIKIDQRTLTRKFNITRLGKDDIILGLPFIDLIDSTGGTFHWNKRTISVPALPDPALEKPPSYFDVWTDLWSQHASLPREFLKTSNKAQEFALEKSLQIKSKTFEELVPERFH